MLELFIISVLIAQLCGVFGEILSAPGFIFDWYIRLIDNLPKWIKNPIGYCSYCMAGQLSLWLYLYFMHDYCIFIHVAFIINTIFFTHIINKILR